MSYYFIAFLVSLFLTVHCAKQDDDKYTTKYDNIDIDEIIRSDRLLKNYVDCLLEKSHCPPEGTELKANMPDALETDCSKCSEIQKKLSQKIISHLIENKPEFWEPLKEKYDPEDKYTKMYQERHQEKESATENSAEK